MMNVNFSMDAWRMKQMKDTKKINLQRRKRKLADLLEKERLEHTVRNVQKSYNIYYIDNKSWTYSFWIHL